MLQIETIDSINIGTWPPAGSLGAPTTGLVGGILAQVRGLVSFPNAEPRSLVSPEPYGSRELSKDQNQPTVIPNNRDRIISRVKQLMTREAKSWHQRWKSKHFKFSSAFCKLCVCLRRQRPWLPKLEQPQAMKLLALVRPDSGLTEEELRPYQAPSTSIPTWALEGRVERWCLST